MTKEAKEEKPVRRIDPSADYSGCSDIQDSGGATAKGGDTD